MGGDGVSLVRVLIFFEKAGRGVGYEIEDCARDNGVEGGGTGEVEKAVEGAEGDGEDGGADGEVARGADKGEEGGEGDAVLGVEISIAAVSGKDMYVVSHRERMPRSCVLL